ncbi:hypothetical protein ACFX13_006994 [Malus domestica]
MEGTMMMAQHGRERWGMVQQWVHGVDKNIVHIVEKGNAGEMVQKIGKGLAPLHGKEERKGKERYGSPLGLRLKCPKLTRNHNYG